MKPRTVFVDFELVDTELSVQEIRDAVADLFNDRDKPPCLRQFHTNVADVSKPKRKK